MSGHVPFKRRKSLVREIPPNVIFRIIWNPVRRTFDVERNGIGTARFAHERGIAIALAIKDAELAARSGLSVGVYSTVEGNKRTEWTSWNRCS